MFKGPKKLSCISKRHTIYLKKDSLLNGQGYIITLSLSDDPRLVTRRDPTLWIKLLL